MVCLLVSAAIVPLLLAIPPVDRPAQQADPKWALSAPLEACCKHFTSIYKDSNSSGSPAYRAYRSLHNVCTQITAQAMRATMNFNAFIGCLLSDCQSTSLQMSFSDQVTSITNSPNSSSHVASSFAFQSDTCLASCMLDSCINRNIPPNSTVVDFASFRNYTSRQLHSCNLECTNATSFLHIQNVSFAERWLQRVDTAGQPVMKERTSEFELSRTYLLVWVIRTVAYTGFFLAIPIWDGIVMAKLRASGQTTDYGKVRIGSSVGQIVSSFLMGIALDFTKDPATLEISYYPCYVIIALCFLFTAIFFYIYRIPESMMRKKDEERPHFSHKISSRILFRVHCENVKGNQVHEESGTILQQKLDSTNSSEAATEEKTNNFFNGEKKSLCEPNKTLAALSVALQDRVILTFLLFSFNMAILYGCWYNFTFWYLKELNASELNVSLSFTVTICFELLGIFTFLL